MHNAWQETFTRCILRSEVVWRGENTIQRHKVFDSLSKSASKHHAAINYFDSLKILSMTVAAPSTISSCNRGATTCTPIDIPSIVSR
jgi:hypothetical protein